LAPGRSDPQTSHRIKGVVAGIVSRDLQFAFTGDTNPIACEAAGEKSIESYLRLSDTGRAKKRRRTQHEHNECRNAVMLS